MEFLNKDAPIVDELGFAQQRDQSHKREKDDTCSIPATRYWLSDTAARDASHHQICKAAIPLDHPQSSPIVQRSID
ncbi:hypothetical protein FOTG_19183 [Fusarium oxysporum f. sp. vasinfectum 25433]|uniref:Uncharacterized protein n=1 Tax=Fusarium oxysporum f. sp. vasinfectum 25433 TaxID=1089449 RepID=X0LUZ0_FUSOX|nr:hypothetical protein FOTG_19183 [Fusarium oxysporum f. sp. vasinfectum 25433]